MNPIIGQQPAQKQSGGYRIPSPSKTAKRSSASKHFPSTGRSSTTTATATAATAATATAHPELHRIMSLFQ